VLRYILLLLFPLFQYSVFAQHCENFESFTEYSISSTSQIETDFAACQFKYIKAGTTVGKDGSRAVCLLPQEGAYLRFAVSLDNCLSCSIEMEQETYVPLNIELYVNNQLVDSVCADLGKEGSFVYSYEFQLPQTINSIQIKQKGGSVSIDNLCLFTDKRDNSDLAFKDVVFSEIMADPDPQVYLPTCEYIELKNNSNIPLDLSELILIANDDSISLPFYEMLSGSFVILHKASCDDLFESCDLEHISVPSFPSLNNSGEKLALIHQSGKLIDYLDYTPSLYSDKVKANGGWSLENSNTESNVFCELCWFPSVSEMGGTPGFENSVFDLSCSEVIPHLSHTCYEDEGLYKLVFSIPVELKTNRNDFVIAATDACFTTFFIQTNLNRFTIEANVIGSDRTYPFELSLGIPEDAFKGDLVINEINPSPFEPASEFVEVYNNSPKFFKAEDLRLATYSLDDGHLYASSPFSETCGLIKPYSYTIVSSDIESLSEVYGCADTGCYIQAKVPSLPASEGIVAVCSKSLRTIDSLHYFPEMHHPDLNCYKGVSLERVQFEASTNDANNWLSATEAVGYATPAYKNSHSSNGKKNSLKIAVSTDFLSLNNDGINDFLELQFANVQIGSTATVSLMKGSLFVAYIFSNSIISDQGSLVWNGKTEDGLYISDGQYYLYVEVYDDNGLTNTQKFAIAVD